jgi:hypothetical protein
MDPHSFSMLDPDQDPNSHKKLDPAPDPDLHKASADPKH